MSSRVWYTREARLMSLFGGRESILNVYYLWDGSSRLEVVARVLSTL